MTGDRSHGTGGDPDGEFVLSPSNGFPGLVNLDVRPLANRIGKKFPLELRLDVGEFRLTIGDRPGLMRRLADQLMPSNAVVVPTITLRVRLRHCYVLHSFENMSIPASSRYRYAHELGGYSDKQSESDKTAASQDRDSSVGLNAAGGLKSGLSTAASFKVAGRWEGRHTVERTTTTTKDLYEVQVWPSGWRIGDPIYGDPVKHGGLLDGQYFARPVEAFPHSCMIEFHRGCRHGHVTFSVTTRDGLVVERLNGPAIESDRDEAIAQMRDRLAAICIERNHAWADDELILQVVTANCAMAVDEQG